MSDPKRLYWDSSCFISVLNAESGRVEICKDVLKNAQLGNVKLFTSLWAVVEVVRPKRPGTAALPQWAEDAISAVEKAHPQARPELEMLWRRHQSDKSLPKLTADQIKKIEGMFFEWKFLELVRIDKGIAKKAVALQRDYNLKAGDAIHVASALAAKVGELQRWDRDFDKVKRLVNVTEPSYITEEGPLIKSALDTTSHEQQKQQTPEPESANDGRSTGSPTPDETRAATAASKDGKGPEVIKQGIPEASDEAEDLTSGVM